MKSIRRILALAVCFVMCSCLLPAQAENYMAKNYVVYQQPNPQSSIVCSIMRGTQILGVLGTTNDGWTKISFNMGPSVAKGWIYQASFSSSGDFSSYPPDTGYVDGSGYPMSKLFLQIVTDEGIKTSSSGGVLGTEEMDEYKTVGVNVTANLYDIPSFSGKVLGTYKTGASVHVLRKSAFFDSNGGFYYVTIAGLSGFMSAHAFIDQMKPSVTAAPETAKPTSVPSYNMEMYVQTGNSGKLYLRKDPYQHAEVIGKYPNGTPVWVYSISNGWANVYVQGQTGYMMVKFLTAQKPGGGALITPKPTSSSYEIRYVYTGNPGKLFMRKNPWSNAEIIGKYPNGTQVQVYSDYNGWCFVNVQGKSGYMMSKFLTSYAPSQPTAVPTAAPTTPPILPPSSSVIAIMYVNTGNSGRLHLRTSNDANSYSLGLYYNGTEVKVHAFMGEWVYVTVEGKTGYMMRKFLSSTQPAPTQKPVVPPSWDHWDMYIKTGNSGKLHLREQPDMNSLSLGLYPNGTKVTVYQYIKDWAEVSVLGHDGFMMRKFLSDTPGSGGHTPDLGGAIVVHPRGSYVNLRSSMSAESGHNILMRITSGTYVDIIERLGGWCKIRYGGMEGYMMSSYLK